MTMGHEEAFSELAAVALDSASADASTSAFHLGIGIAVEHIPALLMTGTRFLIAGLLMIGIPLIVLPIAFNVSNDYAAVSESMRSGDASNSIVPVHIASSVSEADCGRTSGSSTSVTTSAPRSGGRCCR